MNTLFTPAQVVRAYHDKLPNHLLNMNSGIAILKDSVGEIAEKVVSERFQLTVAGVIEGMERSAQAVSDGMDAVMEQADREDRLLSLVKRTHALLSDPDADPMAASLLEGDLHSCLKDMGELEAPVASCHCGDDGCNAQHPDA